MNVSPQLLKKQICPATLSNVFEQRSHVQVKRLWLSLTPHHLLRRMPCHQEVASITVLNKSDTYWRLLLLTCLSGFSRSWGHAFEWTPGVGDGQGGLVCCSPWGHKGSDKIEQLNWMNWVTQATTAWQRRGRDKDKLDIGVRTVNPWCLKWLGEP